MSFQKDNLSRDTVTILFFLHKMNAAILANYFEKLVQIQNRTDQNNIFLRKNIMYCIETTCHCRITKIFSEK
jgi:hypothetical protein